MTRDQFEQQGAQSIGQALQYTSGVAADTRTAFGGYDIIYSRGFAVDRFLDGLRYPGGRDFTAPQIELYGLERLEVLRGPASMLYGASSPGGIVNAISKRPLDTPLHEVELVFGNFNRVSTAFDFTGPVTSDKAWSYRLTGLANNVDSQVDFNEQERYFIAPALTWRPAPGTSITFLANLQHDPHVGLYNQITATGSVFAGPKGFLPRSRFLGEPDFNVNKRDQASIGYAAEHRIDDVWTVKQNLRYMNIEGTVKQFLPLPADSGGGLFGTDLYRYSIDQTSAINVFVVDTNAEAKFSTGPLQHKLLLGVDYQRYGEKNYVDLRGAIDPIDIYNPQYGHLDTFFAFPPSWTDQILNQTGLYVQDQIKWDRLIVTLGAREDFSTITTNELIADMHASQDDKAFTKRIGVNYLLGAGFAPYASYSTSFSPVVGTTASGSALSPTTGEQYEVGIKYQPPGLRALFTVAAYDLTQQNVPTPDPIVPGFQTQTGEIRSRGIEAEAKVSLSEAIDIIGSLTFADTVVTKSNIPGVEGARPVNIPDTTAALWALYKFNYGPLRGFGLGGGVRYISDTAGDETNTFFVPDYTLLDAVFQYDFGKSFNSMVGTKLQVNISNLTDHRYVSQCSNDVTCLYGNGRTVTASIKYQW